MKPIVAMGLLSCGVALMSASVQAQSKMSGSKMGGAMMGSSKMGGSKMAGGMMKESATMRQADLNALMKTLSEEKTEIAQLTAQQAAFRKMGGAENLKISRMWGRWIVEHKAAGPKLMSLIKMHGGNPMMAKVMKSPVLGDKMTMIDSTHKDHVAAVMTSKQRAAMSSDPMVDKAMMGRVKLASKHIRQMAPFHHSMGHMAGGKMSKM